MSAKVIAMREATNLAAIPTLDAIATDPRCLVSLPRLALSALLLRIVVAQSAVVAAVIIADDSAPVVVTEDEMLTPEAAARLLKRDRRWLSRNARRLPFVRRISARTYVCSKVGIVKWLDSRRA